MLGYTFIQWLFFFYIYCMIGWVWECTYCSIVERHLTNRGFMKGPVIPIYGCGTTVMLIVSSPFRENLYLTFIAGAIGATLLEFVTGVAMEALFKVRYWDYSNVPLNLKGYVCAPVALVWGTFAVLLTRYIHVPVERLEASIPAGYEQPLVLVFTVLFVADFALSVKAALDFRDILIRLEAIKAEAERMQKRVDVLLAVAEDEKDKWVDRRVLQISELLGSIENVLNAAKDKISIPESAREELAELRTKAILLKDRVIQLYSFRDKLNRLIVKSNPNMVSKKFQNSLNELKEYYNNIKSTK